MSLQLEQSKNKALIARLNLENQDQSSCIRCLEREQKKLVLLAQTLKLKLDAGLELSSEKENRIGSLKE